jgi:hypothetical protein
MNFLDLTTIFYLIKAVDRGNETEGGYSQSSEQSYEIKIDPFNYNIPEIIYPSKENNVIRLEQVN